MSRARRWCFTLNNFTPQDEQRLQALQPKYLVYGRETGQSGTPHLQGFVIFEAPLRLAAAKTQIGDTAHLETARGTSDQASTYCKKDGDYYEHGSLGAQGKRTDWDEFFEWIKDQQHRPSQKEIITTFPKLWARYSQRMLEISDAFVAPPQLVDGSPRGWQVHLEELLNVDPDPRHVIFNVDETGNTGKSWFCAHMLQSKPDEVQVLKMGKEADMCYAIDENKSIFLIDVPRSRMEYFQYSVVEQLKDRMVFSTKYNSRLKILRKKTHVVVMCNEHPDMEKLSADRYNIVEI